MPEKGIRRCPLCNSVITYEKFTQIVGIWAERQRLEGALKRQLEQLGKEKAKLSLEKRQMRIEMKRAVAVASKGAAERARNKEKRRADKLSVMIEGKAIQIQALNRKVKELQEQLKRGTTPQMEGINYEAELVRDLKRTYPEDRIEHHGKGGDILQVVLHRSREIGRILYECKRTSHFSSAYVRQTKLAIAQRGARYGVLVTLAAKRKTAGFWVEDDVLIVHPFGALHIAEVLRRSILEIFSIQVSAREANRRAANLMHYVKGDEFKALVEDTIYRTRHLYELLKKEMRSHKRIWKNRYDHYLRVYHNSAELKQNTTNILQGGRPTRLGKGELKALLAPTL